jgi:hypothetical protein
MIIELNKSTIQVVRKEVNEAYDQQGVLSELVDAVYWSFGGLHYGNQLLNDFDYLLQRVSVIGQRVHGIWKLETVEEILERIKSIDRDIQNLDSTVCALLTDVAQFKQLSAQRALAIKTTVAMIVATIVAIPTGGSSYVFAWGAVAGSATFVGLAMINHASGRPTTFKEYAIDAAFGAVVGMIAVTGVKIDQYILANAGRVSMLKYLSAQTIVAGGMRAGIAGTAIGAELQFANSIFEGKNPFSPEEAKKIVHSAAMGGVFGFACGVLIQAGVRSYSNWRNPLTPAELSILRGAVAATEAEGRNLNLLWSKLLTAMRNGEASMTPAVLQVMEKLRIKLHFNFIRGADELSAARIEIKMLAQMKLLKPNEIDAFIAALKGDLPDDLARAYFLHASEFSNPRHFLELANEISRKNLVLVTDGGATLNETLAYVGKKHGTTVQVSRIPDYLSATPGAFNGKALILDDYVMQLMEANPGFARSVLDSNCKLVYPQGFDRINIFRQAELTGPTGLAQRLNEDLRAFAAAKADNPNFLVQDWFILKKTETLLEMARNLRMNRSVNARLIPDRMVLITNPKLYGRSPGNMQWAELFDNPAVAWDALRAELSSLNSASRQAVLELMDQNLHFFSPRGLSFDWKAYRAQTIQEAAAMGAGPDDVYYFVFQAEKSNSLAAQHLMEAAGVPANRIVAPRNLGSVPPGKVVVMIDDLNLSGDTFAIQCARFVGQNPNLKFVVAPLAATKVAQRAVERSLSGFGNQRLMAPIRQVEHFETLDWFRFLPSREKELLISIMGKRGYREGSTGISTWYMSPDNNMVTSNPLFNRVIKEFIVSPAGYKLGSGTPFNEVPSGIDGRWLREYQ